jgi:hypothetical protein
LLRDRGLELRESPGELGGVVRSADAHAFRGVGGRLREAGPSERKVLQREPERLRIRELPLEVVERGLEGRELVVVEVEAVEEVVLGPEGVELLARELVALGLQWDAECRELRTVRVEAACKGFVGHLAVPLDVRLHVPSGQQPPLCHQEGDQRELADQLVRVMRHRTASLQWSAKCGALRRPGYAATVACSRCWCDGQ